MNETRLQDILEEYAIRTQGGNDMQVLRQMIDSYPQYAEELEDFAAARAVLCFAPETEIAPEEEARFAELGMQNLRMVLGGKGSNAVASDIAIQSLTETAKAKGMNKKSFAAALGLSVSLVQYLEKRRLDFASIPRAIIAKVGQILEAGEESVVAYLNQPPDSATQASFKATERAKEMPPKDFAEAVREDQILSPSEKKALLDLE